ncbi:VTT domain-containing protein [Phormidium sp. FACHB-1136]|uniref:VTT domain-containing protein n=1 Tax=Phormidium sp. FACHB-1136 TaxID=2692848 RepID=UPI0016847230|nr:VTT domain-containing protein [Phormidium sp. FACHB-1136]MBD2427489.1 VTT domain-containing protein [Phormidium sp. FACHB-1136]
MTRYRRFLRPTGLNLSPKVARLGLMALLAGGLPLALAYRQSFAAVNLESWVAQAGIFGPLVFMVVYAIATVLLLPGSVLTLTGGALFGPVWGTLYNLTGAVLGATLAFLMARYLALDWVEHRVGGQLKQLKQGVEAEGWRFVALVRLVPLLPFNLLNYGLGLTRIPLTHFVLASYLFMLPGAIAYTYLGYAGREAIAGGEDAIQKGLLALSLLALVAFMPRLVKHLRPLTMISTVELQRRLQAEDPIWVIDVRSQADFWGEPGHIPGALNIPLEALRPEDPTQLPMGKDHPLALVCRTDRRSSQAAQQLMRSGFTQVSVVKGGMTDWQRNQFPIQTAAPHRGETHHA